MATKVDVSVNGLRSEVLETIEDWLALEDRVVVEVSVPELARPGDPPRIVLMRAMRQEDRDEWEYRFAGDMTFALTDRQLREQNDTAPRRSVRDVQRGMKSLLVSMCVVNSKGERIFNKTQISILQDRNSAAINRLAEKANELCGFTRADIAALELQAKNASALQDDKQPSP